MNPIVLIPARMAASRLPGKPLADIGGTPMIVRVLRGDGEIAEAVERAGGRAVLTDPALTSGSDRIQAALGVLDPGSRHDVVINLQGDMPFVDARLLRACVGVLGATAKCDIATLVAPETSLADRGNPDVVKAVLAVEEGAALGRALYFTRSTLFGEGPVWRHIGVYGYRREALARFNAAASSPLERRERLEQLRALEIGLSLWAAIVDAAPISVDTPADLEVARAQARGAGGSER
jgi:3-deoxy-manno-octulosonate cytidylyltransferase (CMP-KDO synthetase)